MTIFASIIGYLIAFVLLCISISVARLAYGSFKYYPQNYNEAFLFACLSVCLLFVSCAVVEGVISADNADKLECVK